MELRTLTGPTYIPRLVFLGIYASMSGLCSVSALSAPGAADPTRPKEYSRATDEQTHAGKPASRPRLSSVLIAPNRRLAVIDGRLMTQGERRGGLRLKKILEDRVILRVEGQSQDLTLTLGSPDMQKEVRK